MKLNHIIITLAALVAASCTNTPANVADSLNMATEAVTEGDYSHLQQICDNVSQMLNTADSTKITAEQACQLAIYYMILAEHGNEDDNTATATKCFHYAYDHSTDSLHSFSAQLPLEAQRHFELLRRITVSIDTPVNLMDDDFMHEDYTDSLSVTGLHNH